MNRIKDNIGCGIRTKPSSRECRDGWEFYHRRRKLQVRRSPGKAQPVKQINLWGKKA